MRALPTQLFLASSVALLLALTLAAQQPPVRGGRGRIGGAGIGAYPQRPPGDPDTIERGGALFRTNCAFCHGQDLRGGDGGPSLLRSAVVLSDDTGEPIAPAIREGRTGMPSFALTDAQISDLAAFMHSFRVAGYDTPRQRPDTIVVGDASAGERYFAAKCSGCHSPTGDLAGVATRLPDPRVLQQSWLAPGSMVGRGAAPPPGPRPPAVTVTRPSGEKVTGVLRRVDDFVVSLTTAANEHRSFRLTDGKTKVEIVALY